jgi:hypothetical protein
MKRSLAQLSSHEQTVWLTAFSGVITEVAEGRYADYPLEDRRDWLATAEASADAAVAALRESIDLPRSIERRVEADLTGFVYGLSPIDFWEGWSSPEEIDARTRREQVRLRAKGEEMPFHSCQKEVALARKEIDFCARLTDGWREGPYVAALPTPPDSQIIVAMKGENNGDTYVWTKFALPWLDSDAFQIWVPPSGKKL